MDGHGFTARTLKKPVIKHMEDHRPERSMLAVLVLRSAVHAYIVTDAPQLEIKPTTS